MTDTEALNCLRQQGYFIGTPDTHTGFVRVWTADPAFAVDVRIGRELHEVTAGKLNLNDIRERREDEALAEP